MRLLYLTLALCCANPCFAQQKQDLFGITVGMPRDSFENVRRANYWICGPGIREVRCNTAQGIFHIAFSAQGNVEGGAIELDYVGKLSSDDIEKYFSDLYGQPIERTVAERIGIFVWDLGNGSIVKVNKVMDGASAIITRKGK